MVYEDYQVHSPVIHIEAHHGLSQKLILLANKIDAGLVLALALLAFEIFNFSATSYALSDLLGDISFISVRWATILAIAFCAIDAAGLLRFFSLGQGKSAVTEAWYLMGAWLLGATMNALTAWWAVSIIVLNNPSGSDFLSSLSGNLLGNLPLLDYLPFFVAILIWLTRLLFIGAFGLAAGQLFDDGNNHFN